MRGLFAVQRHRTSKGLSRCRRAVKCCQEDVTVTFTEYGTLMVPNGGAGTIIGRASDEGGFIHAKQGSRKLNLSLYMRLGALLHAHGFWLVNNGGRVVML